MTKLPEPNFIDRDPEVITQEWIAAYEEKSGKVLQPAQIEVAVLMTKPLIVCVKEFVNHLNNFPMREAKVHIVFILYPHISQS